MPWSREDSRYLVTLLAAAGLVAYLLAGNFGLVPSPLAPRQVQPAREFRVAPVPVAAPSPPPTGSPVITRPVRTAAPTPSPGRTQAPTPTPTSSPTPTPPSPPPPPCIPIVNVCLPST